jgi:SSS family solute:Na+ symporter
MDHITNTNGRFNLDLVIPTFVNDIFGSMGSMGELFIIIFILALICAATSTMCALLHTMGAAAGYDLWSETERKLKNRDIKKPSVKITRIATVIMMVVVIILAYLMPPSIIARATSIFMGLTAAAILPAYAHAVFSKSPNELAAKMSILVGSAIWFVWALFICEGIGGILGTGPVVSGQIIYVDPLVIALPISVAVLTLTCILRPKKGIQEDAAMDDVQTEKGSCASGE